MVSQTELSHYDNNNTTRVLQGHSYIHSDLPMIWALIIKVSFLMYEELSKTLNGRNSM